MNNNGITIGVIHSENNPTVVNNDSIVSLGTITREDNVFTFSYGFSWKIDGQTYENPNPLTRTVATSDPNLHRTDIFVLDTNNDIVLIPGEATSTNSIAPIPPVNTIWLCSVDIIGDVVSEPYSPNGANMIFVKGNEGADANFVKLQEAINSANSLMPSASNPVIIICNSGFYLKEGLTIELNEEYVHLYSITGKEDVYCNLLITNSNINVRGIKAESIVISNPVTNVHFENCIAGDNSFNLLTGSFNCSFTNCVGNDNCFLSEDNTIYNYCIANNASFNYNRNTIGTYNYCTANSKSFGYIDEDNFAENSGTFNFCLANSESFSKLRFLGTLNNCTLKADSFNYKAINNYQYKIINCTEINRNVIGSNNKKIISLDNTEVDCQRYDDIFIVAPEVEIIRLNEHIQSTGETKTFLLKSRTANLTFMSGDFNINSDGENEYILHDTEIKTCIEFIWTGEMWFTKSIGFKN